MVVPVDEDTGAEAEVEVDGEDEPVEDDAGPPGLPLQGLSDNKSSAT